ncbi:hypothetical protein HPB50_016227 [Hyalomma asiaticum]|uniref:Uncharacterized protein n=1 Tax=Hyalomma asiaticum TaxID=266040 RepID=A0ACB7SLL4_HYAAI|nr:hypothetical protein HPB50_016227 [Hyalomma asiaticum]
MNAYVRYRDDGLKAVVSVDNIKKFYPESVKDFNSKKWYRAHWFDNECAEDNGYFRAQILKYFATKEEADACAGSTKKRFPCPKIPEYTYSEDAPMSSQESNKEPDDNAMAVFVNTDGFPTKIFPFVDELGITVMDRDAELYNTAALSFVFANGTKARVMCASGSLGTVYASTVYPARSLHKQPSEVPEQATQRAPEDALWRTRMTRFPRDKYKEHFGNIGKKGGLSEAALPVDDEPEFGSLELPGSFADYVGADDDVAVCSEVSLDDIIETVRPDTAGTSDEEEMDDAAEASVSVPTYADVLCYVDHIRRFACARDEIGDLLPDVAAIERKLMRRGWANSQKKITDFFKRASTSFKRDGTTCRRQHREPSLCTEAAESELWNCAP